MQFQSYTATHVTTYHTVPSAAGGAGFEHVGSAAVATVANGQKPDGTADTDVLRVPCSIAGCVAMAVVPLTGGEDAQRLHAKVRQTKSPLTYPTYDAAVASVITDVEAKGGLARLVPGTG